MEVVPLLVRLFLFGIFALAGIGKLLDPAGSEKAVKDFGVPADLAKPLAAALPFAELLIAVSLLFTSTSWLGAIAALLLLLVFIGGMLVQLAKGNAPDCHCFGQIHSEPVGKSSLIRNALFAILSLFLAVQGSDGQGMSLAENDSGVMQTILILAVAAISAVIAFLLKQVLDQQKQILRRLEILELLSHEGVPIEREAAGDPHDGIPIGSPFPGFELANTSGDPVSFNGILNEKKPVLFFFVSPTCDPCKALLPEIEAWQAELSEKIGFVLLSSGDAEENKVKFAGPFAGEVILQEEREIADRVRARWTPSALLVRSDGTIASHLAAGDSAIRHLIEHVRTSDLSSDLLHVAEHRTGGRTPLIGKAVPEFMVADVNGREVTDKDLLGQRTVAVFWSLTCPHCISMMEDLREWDLSKNGSDPALVVFSDGDAEDHSELQLKSPLVLDEGHKTSAKLGMFGTPSAVLIDEKGIIVSETAVGSTNVWALLGKSDTGRDH